MFFISQVGTHDCAFSCLKMMLANYHHDRRYLYLPSRDNRYSFSDLIAVAKEYQMNLIGVKVSTPEELRKNNKFPIIVTLLKKKGIKHAVLVLKVKRQYVEIYDPSFGKMRMSNEQFYSEWTSRALVVESYTRLKCPIHFDDYINKKDKLLLPLLQIVGSICLLVGTYFINEKSLFYLPIIFLSLFVIFEILFRKCLVGAMKRMDDNIYSYDIKKSENTSYKDVYKTIEKYRYLALSALPNFIYSLLVALFITVILIINNYLNVVYIFLPLILSFVEVFFYEPYFKAHSNELVEKENEISQVESDYQFKAKSNEIHKKSYALGLNRSVFTYVEVAILLISTILVMGLSGVINSTYIVFYLCVMMFLKSTFSKILAYSSQSEELDYAKAKLINSISQTSNNS